MGRIGRLAEAAIRWLKKGIQFYIGHRSEMKSTIASVKNLGIASEQLERFLNGLVKVEKIYGSHTHAWTEITAAARSKRAPTNLTADDAQYLFQFKKVFDRTIKSRFKK